MANFNRFDARTDPFGELVDNLFKGYLVRPVWNDTGEPALRMKLDVAEAGDRYVVHAELPGVRREDIQVTIDGAQVTLSAEVKREKEPAEAARWLHVERPAGKATRSFALPQEIDEAKADAKFRDGVLELTLPKKAAAARKQITIQ